MISIGTIQTKLSLLATNDQPGAFQNREFPLNGSQRESGRSRGFASMRFIRRLRE
jgi:hypothetical protein